MFPSSRTVKLEREEVPQEDIVKRKKHVLCNTTVHPAGRNGKLLQLGLHHDDDNAGYLPPAMERLRHPNPVDTINHEQLSRESSL